MAIDLEPLIEPLDGDDPAGPDLAYESERYEIEQAFERPTASGAEDAAVVDSDTNWHQVARRILDQAEKTRDIWLPVYLCRAGALAGDLETVEDGAQYLAGLVETMWGDIHPKLDEYGFQGRKGPCESLTNYAAFLAPLRDIVLLRHDRLGAYTGADFERFRQNAESEDGYGLFRAALEDGGPEALKEIAERLSRIENGLRRTDTVLTDNAEGDTATNFEPTYAQLNELKRSLDAFIPKSEEEDEEAEDTDLGDFGSDDAAPAAVKVKEIKPIASASSAGSPYTGDPLKDRDDVLGALSALDDYYRRVEPGSPVVLLLKRARQWVGLDFLSVLDDIAPSGLTDARQLLISRAERASGGSGSGSAEASSAADSSDSSDGFDTSSSDDSSSGFSFDTDTDTDTSSDW